MEKEREKEGAFTVTSVTDQSPNFPASNLETEVGPWRTAGPKQRAELEVDFGQAITLRSVWIKNEGCAFVEIIGLAGDEEEVLVKPTTFMSVKDSKTQKNRTETRFFSKDQLRQTNNREWSKIRLKCSQPYDSSLPIGISVLKFNCKPPTEPTLPRAASFSFDAELGRAPSLSPSASPPRSLSSTPSKNPLSRFMSNNGMTMSRASSFSFEKSKHDPATSKLLSGVIFVISGIQHPEKGILRTKAIELGAKYEPNWTKKSTHLICAFPNTPKFREVQESEKGIIVRPSWIYDSYDQKKHLPEKLYLLKSDSASSTPSKSSRTSRSKDKGYKSDSEDDDDGTPNEYDRTDSFIDDAREKKSTRKQGDDDTLMMQEAKKFVGKNPATRKRKATQFSEPIASPTKKTKFDLSSPHVKVDNGSQGDESTDEIPEIDFFAEKRKKHVTITEDENKGKHTIKPSEERDEFLPKFSKTKSQLDVDSNSDSTEGVEESEIKTKKLKAHFEKESEKEKSDGEKRNEGSTKTESIPDSPPNPNPSLTPQQQINFLPSFFEGFHFNLFGDFMADEERKLIRYITAYGGILDDEIGKDTTHILAEEWVPVLNIIIAEKPEILILHSSWVFECHSGEKVVNPQPYLLERPDPTVPTTTASVTDV